ncbi:hypothetical protein [Hydrocoleum sp. CS-953]|nr:hypothetical protein [Hydrocoleum sp. CS-953]
MLQYYNFKQLFHGIDIGEIFQLFENMKVVLNSLTSSNRYMVGDR